MTSEESTPIEQNKAILDPMCDVLYSYVQINASCVCMYVCLRCISNVFELLKSEISNIIYILTTLLLYQ